jgi:hypothetical protein
MDVLKKEQITQIYEVTDGLYLHRNAVIVPLMAKPDGLELIMPDGRVLIRAPVASFNSWLSGLKSRLEALPLQRARTMQ